MLIKHRIEVNVLCIWQLKAVHGTSFSTFLHLILHHLKFVMGNFHHKHPCFSISPTLASTHSKNQQAFHSLLHIPILSHKARLGQERSRGSLNPKHGVRQLSRNGYTLSRMAKSTERAKKIPIKTKKTMQ